MKKKLLYGSWILLYIICAVTGFAVTDPDSLQCAALLIFSVLFFLPPCVLLVDAHRKKDQKALLLLRWISGLSLLLTLILLVANVVSALSSAALGNVLYAVLVLVSVPMISSHQWFFSLLVWACVFFATLGQKRK